MRLMAVVPLAVLTFTGLSCAGAPRSPTTPSSVTSGVDLAEPRLTVRIDQGASVAILGSSEVTFDASATRGDKLRYEVQFGDGASTTTVTSTHVYMTEGTFTATLMVTDAAGRQTTTSQRISVRSVRGAWFHAGLNRVSRRFEVRRISIASQDASEFRGFYSFFGEADRTFRGRLSTGRHLSLTLDDGSGGFDGTIPSEMGDTGAAIDLVAQGGSANGQTLAFAAVPNETPGPDPRAALSIRFANREANETGSYPAGRDLTFDTSFSSGDRLSYWVEFGDGESAQESVAQHAIENPNSDRRNAYGNWGAFVARALVVDRFGRADATSRTFSIHSVLDDIAYWFNYFNNPATHRAEFRMLRFTGQKGRHATGFYRHPEGWESSFTATLEGTEIFRILLDDGTIELTGTIEVNAYGRLYFLLTIRGGSADGATLAFGDSG